MNFICDDNSYRSTQACADLTTAIQVELMTAPECEWVERAELEKADQELKLLSFGLMDRSEAIRFGHRLKADWAVFGRISTNSSTGREMQIEVTDLTHADVLAQALIPLAAQPDASLKLNAADISLVATNVHQLIIRASQTAAADQGKSLLAFLFLAPEAINNNLADFSSIFQQGLDSELTNSPFHLLHLQRAAVSQDEAELVLGGFARSDRDPKERLADIYVWGTYSSQELPRFDPTARRFNRENVFQSRVTLWDGQTEPRLVTLAVTNAGSQDAIAQQLAHALVPLLRANGAGTNSEDVRQRAADSVLKQAMALLETRGHPSLESAEGRKDWLTLVQMFETACFIDPFNVSAREWAARLRWSNFVGLSSRNEFFFARRRSEAWGKYVEDFSFRTGPLPPPRAWGNVDSVAKEYVLSAWRPFEMFQYAQENQAQWGMPRDAGGPELLNWRVQFGNEFFARLLRAPEEPAVLAQSWSFLDAALSMTGDKFIMSNPQQRQQVVDLLWKTIAERQRAEPGSADPDIVRRLALHCQQIGRPGGEKVMLAQLDRKARSPVSPEPKIHQVKLPRISALDSDTTGSLFNLPPIVFPVPRSGPEQTSFHLAPGLGVRSIRAAELHQGKIYLALEIPEAIPQESGNATGDSNLQHLNAGVTRLWVLDPETKQLKRAPGPIATNIVTSLFSDGMNLWAAASGSGIFAWNTERNSLKQYAAAEGLTATNLYGLAGGDTGICALGGVTELFWLPTNSLNWVTVPTDLARFGLPYIGEGRRLALSGNHLLLFSSGLVLEDLRSSRWTQSNQIADEGNQLRVNQMIGDRRDGFWVASSSGLYFIDAQTGVVRSQRLAQTFTVPAAPQLRTPPGMRLPAAFQPRRPEGEFERVLGRALELRHGWAMASKTNAAVPNPFKPGSRLPGPPLALAMDGDYLWVLTADPQTAYSGWLLLYDPAKHQWINSAQIRGDRPSLVASNGKAWVISASAQEMEVHAFDQRQWLNSPPEQHVADTVSDTDLTEFVARLSPMQQALCALFWGQPDRVLNLLSEQEKTEANAECLFVLALANDADGLNHSEEKAKYTQHLLSEFPDSPLAVYISSQEKLAQVRARALERKASPPTVVSVTNRTELASQRASSLLRDYDADGDGKLSIEELALACELEPERLPVTPYPFFRDKPLESARNLMNRVFVGSSASLDLAALQRGFLAHPIRGELTRPGARRPPTGLPPGSAVQSH